MKEKAARERKDGRGGGEKESRSLRLQAFCNEEHTAHTAGTSSQSPTHSEKTDAKRHRRCSANVSHCLIAGGRIRSPSTSQAPASPLQLRTQPWPILPHHPLPTLAPNFLLHPTLRVEGLFWDLDCGLCGWVCCTSVEYVG